MYMKTSPFLIAVAASLLPTLTMGLVGLSWSVVPTPSTGLTDITFPFSIANSPHRSGYYFAQQFLFRGQSDVGYTGLQPRPDSKGSPIIHAVFSSFIAGTTTADSNCHAGADGGPGVSCAVEFPGPYANTYNIEIRNTVGTTWDATAVDTVTGRRVHIGSYKLPAGTGGIQQSQAGFVEYYPWNAGTHTCNSLPFSSVVFGVPTTTTKGAGKGALQNAYEYGDCVGKVAFQTRRTPTGGVEVRVGFN